jgi:flavin reductase (DIM6/NTAB) family NADH-FMN oxidoreductase RutF
MTDAPTSTVLRQAFACYPSGVAALCVNSSEGPVGLAASSFTPVSLEPPLVSVCIAHSSSTWPRMADAPRFGVSVLAADQDAHCLALSSKTGDRFANVGWEATEPGAVLVHGAALWLECELFDVVAAGDHDIVLLRVENLWPYPDIAPLVFHGSKFRKLAA